jgi:hypothetical protein
VGDAACSSVPATKHCGLLDAQAAHSALQRVAKPKPSRLPILEPCGHAQASRRRHRAPTVLAPPDHSGEVAMPPATCCEAAVVAPSAGGMVAA